jgi:glycosyltransferase involved in cell wall biosynthesis
MNAARRKIIYIAQYYSEDMRRTLGLTSEYSPGGLNKILPMVSLLARDHDVTLLSTGYTKRAGLGRIKRREESLCLDGRTVRVIYPRYFALRQASFVEIAWAWFRECLRQKPDVIMFYNFRIETFVPAGLSKLFGRARIICQFEDGLHVLFSPWSIRGRAFRILYFLGKRWSDGFTLVNGCLEGEFPRATSAIVPFILADEACAGYAPARYDLRGRDVVKVAYAGSLDMERGADLFLEAAERLLGNSRFRFFMAGQGPLLGRVLGRAHEQDNLEYAGVLSPSESRRWLYAMDVLVNPQRLAHPFARYSFPSKVMSYILLNKPIVSSAFPDITGVPAQGLFFYGGDDPADLARVLAELPDREIEVDYRALFEKFSEAKTRAAVTALLERVHGLRENRSISHK